MAQENYRANYLLLCQHICHCAQTSLCYVSVKKNFKARPDFHTNIDTFFCDIAWRPLSYVDRRLIELGCEFKVR